MLNLDGISSPTGLWVPSKALSTTLKVYTSPCQYGLYSTSMGQNTFPEYVPSLGFQRACLSLILPGVARKIYPSQSTSMGLDSFSSSLTDARVANNSVKD